ncbi:MAG TPA: MBL fold metallo-hydrolase [Thermoanaerobaculia bacterium]|jgi:phosphoribosyl 1,2-cyclic phosphate phosphodiesterase|nr:MBL fold metallo-hydrolase [Thermoanaerobaculia bacterium]MDI9631999.1 MBL fold metallo-hydrolase [Acidobacteriota bacterium]MBP7813182.1 MBL fold metallo-hydrolase [Thermoanaerobaculia bacterium]MBP8844930.1 MBL fold metallo-hydrolase [Thermoanaerobaculia bacterium]HPA95478.1 MBL fold metallo-hydrolase [Thermoanaerobaculia bacterium]
MTLRRVTMLGSGTSSGVPVIGCTCPVCTSADPRNRRLRASVRLELAGGTVLVDTSPDLREQALRSGLDRLDAILFTHAHADHLFGLDDVRIFNFRQRAAIPCFGSPATLERVRTAFSYVFEEGQEGGGKPQLELRPVNGPFELLGARVVPVPVWHGSLPVLGYRIDGFAYVTDVNRIPEESYPLLAGLEVLVLGALRYRPHPTHFSIGEAVAVAARIGARRTFFTHLAHDVDHAAPALPLPPGVAFGHDGLELDLS